jgi:hypothetical protein
MKASLNQVALVPCETLGTLFVDIVEGNDLIGREVARVNAEQWLADLQAEKPEAEDAYVRMRNILTDPVRAAGSVVHYYRPS